MSTQASATVHDGDSTPDRVEAPVRPSLSERAADLGASMWRPALLLLVLLGLWWATTTFRVIPRYLVPSPQDTFAVFRQHGAYLAQHLKVTAIETLLGFVIAAVLGTVAAVIMVASPTIERTLYPVLLFAQVIPKIAVAPLFVVWLGFGLQPKIVMAVLISFFPVVIDGVVGLRSTEQELMDLSATMGAPWWKTFWKIRFPGALPQLFSGLKVAATLAVVGAVVGEFVGANEGLGFVLLQANGNLDSPMLFAGLIVMSLLGIGLFLIIEVLEAFLLPWHTSRRSGQAATTTM